MTIADEFADVFGPHLPARDADMHLDDMDEFFTSRMGQCVPDRAEAEQNAENGESFDMVYSFGDRSKVTLEIEYGSVVGWEIG